MEGWGSRQARERAHKGRASLDRAVMGGIVTGCLVAGAGSQEGAFQLISGLIALLGLWYLRETS